jgi:hypothetical protein
MRVEEVLSMADYDRQAAQRWPLRIPDVTSKDLARRLGDCIYDFSENPPLQRASVHNQRNQPTDLSGKNALISRHFYYFGNKARPLPTYLRGICHQTEGHRSDSNAEFLQPFVQWLDSLSLSPGQLYGWPDYVLDWADVAACGCPARHEDAEREQLTASE